MMAWSSIFIDFFAIELSPSTSCPNGAHQDIQIASLEQKTKTVTFKTELTGKSGIGVGMVKFKWV